MRNLGSLVRSSSDCASRSSERGTLRSFSISASDLSRNASWYSYEKVDTDSSHLPVADEQRFPSPLEDHVLSLRYVRKIDLDLGQGQHIGGRRPICDEFVNC